MTVRNSTIVDNVAGADPEDPSESSGGGIYLFDSFEDTTPPIVQNGPLTISSTIIADNTADSGPDLGQGEFADGFVSYNSLVENTSGATITGANNITGTDPDLGSLQDNGGPTETFLLPNLDLAR